MFKKLLENKKILWILAAVAVVLVAGILLAVLLPGGEVEPNPTTTGAGVKSYTISLQTEGGMPLAGVDVFLYGDEACTDLVAVGKTGTDGSATITANSAQLYAVLKGIPAGYALETCYPITQADTQLVFKTQLQTAMGSVSLGSIMFDFTVTATDGTQYTLSELLKTKKAVVLNFWYADCDPCKSEFPFLQEAYDSYSEEIAVLALSPLDDAATVAQYHSNSGLTLPMAAVDPQWINAIGLQFYPTTLIIDRYGMVSLKHVGAVTEAVTFVDAFGFFAAEDYQQQVVTDITDLQVDNTPDGSAEKPFEFGGVSEFELEIEAGATIHCQVFRVSGMLLSVNDTDVSVLYDAQTYKPENGTISFVVTTPDTYTPVMLAFTNEGSAKKTVKVKFDFLPGTMDKPYALEPGEVSVDIAAGNSVGVYYAYTADKAGVLSVQCQSVTEGVDYGFTLYNLNSYVYRTVESDGEDGLLTISVAAGDVVQFVASTLPDETNEYPAAQMRFLVTFEEGAAPTQPSVPETTPTVPTTPPTTVPPETTVPVTTVPPSTTVPMTTVPPSTTVPVTSVPPSTTAPVTTVPPTTAPVVTVPPATTVPPTTAPTQPSAQFTELYFGKAYHVYVGTNNVTLTPDKDRLTYFLFTPEESGTYQIIASAEIRYFGSNTSYVWDQTDNMGVVNNTLTLNVKETSLGASYVLAVKASAGSGTLTVTRTGEATLEWEDLPYDVYDGVYTPKDFTYTGGTLTYVTITGKPSNYVPVLGSDGFYHLNSADGPLLYLNLGGNSTNPAKETDTTLYAMLHSNRPIIQGTVKDENGNNLYKRQYNDLVQKYIDCADKGLYPLTPDLVEILKTQNDNWYLWLASSNSRVNKEMAWMANICYEQQ